jgi:hypothetical protein
MIRLNKIAGMTRLPALPRVGPLQGTPSRSRPAVSAFSARAGWPFTVNQGFGRFVRDQIKGQRISGRVTEIFSPVVWKIFVPRENCRNDLQQYRQTVERARRFLLEAYGYAFLRHFIQPMLEGGPLRKIKRKIWLISRYEFLPEEQHPYLAAYYFVVRRPVKKGGVKTHPYRLEIAYQVDLVLGVENLRKAVALVERRSTERVQRFGKLQGSGSVDFQCGVDFLQIQRQERSEGERDENWVLTDTRQLPMPGKVVAGHKVIGFQLNPMQFDLASERIARELIRENNRDKTDSFALHVVRPMQTHVLRHRRPWRGFIQRVFPQKDRRSWAFRKFNPILAQTIRSAGERWAIQGRAEHKLEYFEKIRTAIRSGLGEVCTCGRLLPRYWSHLGENVILVIGSEMCAVNYAQEPIKILERLGDVWLVRLKRYDKPSRNDVGTATIEMWAEVKIRVTEEASGSKRQIEDRFEDLGPGARLIYPNTIREARWWEKAPNWKPIIERPECLIFSCDPNIHAIGEAHPRALRFTDHFVGMTIEELQSTAQKLTVAIFSNFSGFDEIRREAQRLTWPNERSLFGKWRNILKAKLRFPHPFGP